MTNAKEKAAALVEKYRNVIGGMAHVAAKQCAIIAVEEVIATQPRYPSYVDWDDAGATYQLYYEAQMEEAMAFWQSVKIEIEQL